MPRGDRTGPNGEGPRTGRGMGYCGGYKSPGYKNSGFGRGYGRGLGRGARFATLNQTQSSANEEQSLKQELNLLKDEIKAIEERLKEIKNKE